MNKIMLLGIISIILLAGAVFAQNTSENNETINAANSIINNSATANQTLENNSLKNSLNFSSTIKIILNYNGNTPYDEDNDGVETINGVIDLSVISTQFNWQADETKLCTLWETYSIDDKSSTRVCYGSQQCCNFIDLIPTKANWSELYYSAYGQYGAGYNNTISAQVIYVDYSLTPDDPYAEVYYSEWESLDAKYIAADILGNVFTKIIDIVIGTLSVVRGNIVKIGATLVNTDNEPIPFKEVALYANETLIGTKLTNISGNVVFEWNTTPVVPGEYLLNISFAGQRTVIHQETIGYMPSFNFVPLKVLPKNGSSTQVLETVQGRAEIGKEVEWTQKIKVVNNETSTKEIAINITVPKEAEDIIIEDTREKENILSEEMISLETAGNKSIEFTDQLKGKEEKEFDVKYNTSAPEKIEADETISEGKIVKNVTIRSEASVHYKNILSYANIAEAKEEQVRLYWIVNGSKVDIVNKPEFNVTFYDMDNNGLVDKVSWIVQQLSEQQFVIEVILITKANHLDENKSIISDIYDQVIEKDNTWSEPIYEDEFVRVTFGQKLDASKDITVYARNNQSLNTYIEVYLENSTEKITEFPIISEEKYYRILLTGMEGSHDTFDLKIVNNDAETDYLEFDHIIDPVAYVLEGAVYSDNTDTDFSQGTLHLTNVSGSGKGANVTLNSTTINTFKVYNTTGNFTSRLLDAVVNTSTFSNIAWYSVMPNSTDAMGYANDNGANDLAVFYRNGSHAYAGDPDNFNNDATTITAELLTYTLSSGSYDDIVGSAMDDDGSDEANIFLINGTVLSTADLGNTGLKQSLSFATSSTWSIPDGFNATNILGFVINSDGTEAAVFFKNKSFVTDPDSENPPFIFTDVYSFTVPSGFDMEKILSVAYDRGANDIALLLNNNSFISDPSQTDLTTNSDIIDHHVIAYFSDLKLITYSNITLQTRVSNDTVTFSSWSKNYTNPTGTEVIAEPNIARYIQYKAVFNTPDKYITPFLENVSINFTDLAKPRINSSINNSAPKINEVVNISANVSDNIGLSFCQFVINQSSGAKEFINISVSGTDGKCSQNFTVSLGSGNVINFTVIVNDTTNNLNQSEHTITVANTPAPQASIVFPTSDLKTNRQPLDLNITFAEDPDGDVINVSYYIDGALNQTQIELNTTFNASDGTYILNVSLFDGVSGAAHSENATVNFTIDTVVPVVNASLNESLTSIKFNDVINLTANATDSVGLSFGQIIVNDTGSFRYFNFSLNNKNTAEFSQNITVSIGKGGVINFTARVNDSAGNFRTNDTIITVANTPAPQASIVFPTSDLKTNRQPLDLNITFAEDPDGDVINVSYYIDGALNQTSLTNTTLNASDGTYILNVSLFDGVSGAVHSANATVNFTIDTVVPVVNATLNKSLSNITVNDIINITANATDEVGLSFGQIIVNISGFERYFNFSLNNALTAKFSQNITINVSRSEVINFTARVNDSAGNFRTNDTIITVANTPPAGLSVIQPSDNQFTNLQPFGFNVTFKEDPDRDTTTINYYIDGSLNDSTTTNTTFNASDGTYILNVSITDGVDHHSNITINFTVDTANPIINATLNKSLSNITVNDIINITANATDEVGLNYGQIIVNDTGSVRFFNFSLNNKLTAAFSQNITIGATRGQVINFTARVNDSAGNFRTNDTIITVANTPPRGLSVLFPTDDLNTSLQPLDINITFSNDLDGDAITINYYIDGALNDSTTTNTTFNASDGHYLLNVSITDGVDHPSNVTVNFTVDTTIPTLNKISFSPNSTDDVDPSVLLNFTINSTDSTSGVKRVVLQYKQSGAGLFTNATARYESTDNLYYANFTPNIADTWQYRIYASDHAGNNDSSDVANISVENDRTWKRLPATFANIACGFAKTCHVGNLTINNTGDFTLNFDLSSNFGATSFNATEPFDLAAKEVRVVEVNLTAGSSAAESNVVITTDATTSSADPDSDTTNFTFTASAGGPVFDITIINPPTEVNKSDAGAIYLNASLKNIGNESAGDTSMNWTLPSNWLNVSGTNLTQNFTTISAGITVYHNITVNLTSDASTGTQKVNVTAGSNNSASDSATASIVVTETSTSTTTTTTTTTTGGGGGGGGGGTGGGGGSAAPAAKAEEIEISQVVDLVRGEDNTFTIRVNNTFKDSVLVGLKLQIEGFLSQYLTIAPAEISGLRYSESEEFIITVAAPAYAGYEEHTLKATVTGMLVKTEKIVNATVTSRNPYILTNYISLIIHEIGKEEADNSLAEAAKAIEDMQNAGFSAKKSLKLLEEAKEKLNSGKYQLAKGISSQVIEIKENAFSANSLIQEIISRIKEAENKGLQVEETKRLLNLAFAAFEREDFLTAIQRAKDAQLSIVIETKGKFNVVKFIIDYWFPILVGIIALAIIGYFTRKKFTLIIISRRLDDLEKEEITLHELMEETQTRYYKDKKINTTEYHKAMLGYEERLGEVSQSISRLRSKRVGIIEISSEIKNLKKEDVSVVDLIKQLQESYYNRQSITRKVYLKRIKEYKLRRIEIERSIAVMEAKLAKKEKLEELEDKEIPEKNKLPEKKLIPEAIEKEANIKELPPPPKPEKKFSLNNLFKKEKKKQEKIMAIGNPPKEEKIRIKKSIEEKEKRHAIGFGQIFKRKLNQLQSEKPEKIKKTVKNNKTIENLKLITEKVYEIKDSLSDCNIQAAKRIYNEISKLYNELPKQSKKRLNGIFHELHQEIMQRDANYKYRFMR